MVKKETKGARRQKVIWSIRGYSQRRKTALILWSAACRDNEDRRKDDGTAEKGNIKEAFKYVCSYFHMDGKELMNTNVKRKLKEREKGNPRERKQRNTINRGFNSLPAHAG